MARLEQLDRVEADNLHQVDGYKAPGLLSLITLLPGL